MTWKGIVSHDGESTISTRQQTDSAAQPSSSRSGRGQAIAGMSHRLDRTFRPELLAQAANAHVDHVGAGIERVPPHLREQALAAHHLACMHGEVVQEPELAVGEVDATRL